MLTLCPLERHKRVVHLGDVNMAVNAVPLSSRRSSPHPYITALENRADCWPALLLEIDDFIGLAAGRSAWLQRRPWALRPIIPLLAFQSQVLFVTLCYDRVRNCRDEQAYIAMLAPFLRYLYCEPQRQPQHALLRHGLLRALLPVGPGARSVPEDKGLKQSSPAADSLLHCLCQLVPYMQVTR